MGWQVWVVNEGTTGDEGEEGERGERGERGLLSFTVVSARVYGGVCWCWLGRCSANAVGTLQNTEVAAEITQLCAAKLRRIGLQSRTSPIASPAAVLERRTEASC